MEELWVEKFNPGVLLLVILISSLDMAFALIRHRRRSIHDVEFLVSEGDKDPVVFENKDLPEEKTLPEEKGPEQPE